MSADATLADQLRNLPQYLLPQRLSSRAAYRLTRITTPWFKNRMIRAFCAHFGVDLSEAVEPNPEAYEHFNAFFTRALNAAARPLAPGQNTLCSPVDGTVSQLGRIDDGQIFQAKGRQFSLTALLGGTAARAEPFRHGWFATLYLSPRDYHRIHMPLAGELREMVHIPGRLFSVSPLTTRVVPELFARNERVVNLFDTASGPLAVVMVGAINVASMETVWAGTVTPPLGSQIRTWRYPKGAADSITLAKGAEMGRFNMGSTVILIMPQSVAGADTPLWDQTLSAGTPVRMGQKLGEIKL